MPPDPQRERRGVALEAGVASADGPGGDEAAAFEALVALAVRQTPRIAPVDPEAVPQGRPVRKVDLLDRRPVQPQFAVEAHRAGGALVVLADVDHGLATVRAQRRV